MTIFFYKGLAINPEIVNAPVWVLPNQYLETGDCGTLGIPKFGTNLSNEMLPDAANAKVTAFTVSELLRLNQKSWGRMGVGGGGGGGGKGSNFSD